MTAPARQLGSTTTSLLVVASMIGTGVFTTTGFLVRDLGSPAAVLAAWVVGGITALCGALCYAELTAAMPHNGADYTLLGSIFHPSVACRRLITLVVGFAAPTAVGDRLRGVPCEDRPVDATVASGLLLITVASAFHAARVSVGVGSELFTAVKVS
jgi:APA family basic amino acid/polyamine antiporter